MAAKIKTDELVKHLTVDGEKREDITMLSGFIGEGSQENSYRLFFDPTLKNSVEIREDDILYSVKISKTHSAFGGTIIWIKNASFYFNNQPSHLQTKAEQFFEGKIYQEYVNNTQKTQSNNQSACQCC